MQIRVYHSSLFSVKFLVKITQSDALSKMAAHPDPRIARFAQLKILYWKAS